MSVVFEYSVLSSATGEIVDSGACTAEEKDDLKLEWPAKDGYEILFRRADRSEFPDGEFPDPRQWTDPLWGIY